eukprot:836000-Alexandrium_andersonii.AAC.1
MVSHAYPCEQAANSPATAKSPNTVNTGPGQKPDTVNTGRSGGVPRVCSRGFRRLVGRPPKCFRGRSERAPKGPMG